MCDTMGKLENDCLALLCYIADHPEASQDYRNLEEELGIPWATIRKIIYYPWYGDDNKWGYWALEKYAEKYRFDFAVLHNERGKHLSVIRR